MDSFKNFSAIDELLRNKEKLAALTKTVFEAVDTDGSGSIDIRELKVAMEYAARECGLEVPSDADVDETLSELDDDNSGTIDIKEFRELIVEALIALQQSK
mmetsp:Transcript_11765/g.22756  ORF Transcript_11765/g.22756 Transcript_11765/m.22756 type:complete len:101 (+) Transcript_11765:867-1169(+)